MINRTCIKTKTTTQGDKVVKIKIYQYHYSDSKKVPDKDTLERIYKLHIPPGWKNVEVSRDPTDYLQVSGIDESGKTQYIYHPLWVTLSKVQKFNRLGTFIDKLPLLMNSIKYKLNNYNKNSLGDYEFLLALVFRILYKTYSRIGNECYAEENNTYGLTTLLKSHLKFKGTHTIILNYIGKRSVVQNLEFDDPLVYKILKDLIKLPGPKLFKTTSGIVVRSLDMNYYLKEKMGENFTVKDFRTYASNKLFIDILSKKEIPLNNEKHLQKNIRDTYIEVAEYLGHTATISKKSYVMDLIPETYLKDPKKFITKDTNKLFKKILDET